MSLSEQLQELIAACFTGIWIESSEPHEAALEITRLAREQQWKLATWDLHQGLRVAGTSESLDASDPLSAIHSLAGLAEPEQTTVLVMSNLHRFLQSPEIVQALQHRILAGKHNRTFVIGLSPTVSLPIELQKLIVIVEHQLPTREQLEEIAREVATEEDEIPSRSEFDQILDAAAGLTRLEAEGAFSLSIVREDRLTADSVWELKSQTLKKSGLLDIYQGGDDFNSLGGLDSLKSFCKRSLLRSSNSQRPKGVLLLSPPGCGKSQFCKSLGKETGRPVLILDVGSLMGSLVGQSEERTRQALRIVDAMAPCIVMIDEIEKAFAGVGNSNDSGVSARMFGTFLTWLNDHESDAYVVCTSNDISKLPPEFGRSERFDGIFFLDLPSADQRELIWQQYLDHFSLDDSQRRPQDENWTGAEIRACCRLAALLDVPLVQAAQNIVPVAVTANESVQQLRQWASERCLNADGPGVYRLSKPGKKRRQIRQDPSIN